MLQKITSTDQLKSIKDETEIYKSPINAFPQGEFLESDSLVCWVKKNNLEMEVIEFAISGAIFSSMSTTMRPQPISYADIISSGIYWTEQ